MRMLEEPLHAGLFAGAGLLLYTGMLMRETGGYRTASGKGKLAFFLPALLAVLLAKIGYVVLQPAEPFSSFRWCFTTGLAGLLLGTAAWAWMNGERAGLLLDRMAAATGLAMAFARFSQRWLGEVGAGPWIEGGILRRMPFLLLVNDWDETLLAIFVPEALLGILAAAVVWLRRARGRRGPREGCEAALTIVLLTIPQIFLEQFRSGHYMHWRMVRAEQVLCALAAGAVIVYFSLWGREKGRALPFRRVAPGAVYLLLCGLVVLVQFILDGKLLAVPETACWVIYVMSVLGMLLCALHAIFSFRVRMKRKQ